MPDRHQLLESLSRHAGRARAPVLVIHSSLIHLGLGPGDLKYEFLAALRTLIQGGATIAIPTFTFEFCRSGIYDFAGSRPETGILGQWMLELEGSFRTPHPIYSLALAGARAAELATAPGASTF